MIEDGNMATFQSLGLVDTLLRAVEAEGYESPTPVQEQSIPPLLAGRDVLGVAQTGTGKTAAFTLPVLQIMDRNKPGGKRHIRALILSPTRELAAQIDERLGAYSENMDVRHRVIFGGVNQNPQVRALQRGLDVLVATPGRLLDLVGQGHIDLSRIEFFVLDEADRMLDMGFYDELEVIFQHLPQKRQTLLFSATYPDTIAQISDAVQKAPQRIETQSLHTGTKIEQIAYKVTDEHRDQAVAAVLSHYQAQAAIVFCHTKAQTFALTEYLQQKDIAAVALNGDLEQRERTQVLTRFAHKSALVLVATDVAARGLDIDAVDVVINYTVTEEPDVYVHRIGRTGRADAEGLAVTLVSESEMAGLRAIEAHAQVVLKPKGIESVRYHANRIVQPAFATLSIDGGKRQKLRPGDILGALTKEAGIDGDDIGKINVTNQVSFIAVKLRSVKRAMAQFREGKIKGKKFRARRC